MDGTETLANPRKPGVAQYVAIAETIRSWLLSGRYKAGDTIATIDELAKEFNVAKGTIQEALRVLSDSGVVITSRGKRTRFGKLPEMRPVRGRIGPQDLLFVEKFGEQPDRLLSVRVLKPGEEMQQMFQFTPQQFLTEYRTILFLNDRPNAYSMAYLLEGHSPDSDLVPNYDEFKIKIRATIDNAVASDRRIAATTADIELSNYLSVPVGMPLLRYSCAMWGPNAQFMVYFTNYLRSDDCEYKLDA